MWNWTLTDAVAVVMALAGSVFCAGAQLHRMADSSRSVICRDNLKHLFSAAASYAAEGSDMLPAGNTGKNDRFLRWNHALLPYFATEAKHLPVCPAAVKPAFSYGANYCYNRKRNARLPFYFFDAQKPVFSKLARYSRQLPDILMFADAERFTTMNPRQIGCAPIHDLSGNGVRDSARNTVFNNYAPKRHGDAMNYVSCGGSVHDITFEFWEDQLNHSGIIYDEQFDY